MHPYTNIFGVEVATYGLISLLGVLVSGAVAYFLAKSRGLDISDLFSTALVAGLGLLLGAHLLYAVTRHDDIIALAGDFEAYTSLWDFVRKLWELSSGMVFYGGLYGGLLFGYLWCRRKHCPLRPYSDLFAVVIPLFHSFGRVGCFFAGCCYGVECEWGIAFRILPSGATEYVKRLPVQLIESALLLLLFALLLVLYLRGNCKGLLMCLYLSIYAVLRFALEFFRGDEVRGRFLLFSTSQWISLLTVTGVAVCLLYRRHKMKIK